MPSPEPIPTREIFLHLGTGPQVAFYVLGGLASVTFLYGFWRRYKKYRRGRSENRFDNLGGRIARAFVTAVGTKSEDPLHNTFTSSLNSHAAVLAANISDQLDGQRINLNDLLYSDDYHEFRKKSTEA